jgi:adenosylcobinamide-phosphate synthase
VNTALIVLLGAILLDLIHGEPPARIHPVVWMGKLISFLEQHSPETHRKLYGMLMVLATTAPFTLLGIGLTQTDHPLAILASIYLLKSTFSINMLSTQAKKIQRYLEEGNIDTARSKLKAFVSRDTRGFNATKISSAVIESISENYVDSILTPLFYYTILGLPGALAYKAINTLDSMIGYQKPPYTHLGYASAKLDDLLNYIPARLSLLFITLAALSRKALECALREHSNTPSPNSGWPMAATAGALNITLEKPDTYTLNPGVMPPAPQHIAQATGLIRIATAAAIITSAYILTYLPVPR